MGLSEREQQLLDEMERSLYRSEADVMQTRAPSARLNLRSLVLGIVVIIAGVAALIAGVAMQQLWIGVVGFAIMLGGALLAFSKRDAIDESANRGSRSASQASGASASGESFSERLERRWDQRMNGER